MPSEVTVAGRDEQGRWLPGHVGVNGPHKHAVSLKRALQEAFTPESIISEYHYHIFVRHSESALTDYVDRVLGKATQALTVDPGVETMDLLEQLVRSQIAGSDTLIEAPISQPEPND